MPGSREHGASSSADRGQQPESSSQQPEVIIHEAHKKTRMRAGLSQAVALTGDEIRRLLPSFCYGMTSAQASLLLRLASPPLSRSRGVSPARPSAPVVV